MPDNTQNPTDTVTLTTQSPKLDASGQQHLPAIKDIQQVIAIVKALDDENRKRTIKNERIASKYNAERPHAPEKLKADGIDWKSNFSTKPLATLIDKVVPRFTTALKNMRYLTASELPDRYQNAAEKTEAFRSEITKTCRGREGWDDCTAEIAMEDSLFGYCGVAWLDRYSWFPKAFRQEDFLIPSGTKHTAKSANLCAFKESYLVHELFELIQDFDAATTAGWNVPEVINSINDAVPVNMRSGYSDTYRIYADLARESSTLTSFTGSKSVEVWHVLVTEVDGYVTHIAYDKKSENQLFRSDKQFDRMADAAAFFSFQHGNGKIHGSKGIGRELYAMAGVLDRARNEVVDRLNLSGKIILQCDEKDIKRFRMSVIGNAVLIASGYAVQQAKVEGEVESFFALDKFLTELLDQIAGSTSPKVFDGERVTKAAVELYAAREEERRDAIIERFLSQFARMMTTVQKRLCNPQCIDPDALEMQKRLLKVMSQEELDYLANQPAVTTVSDYSDIERQQVVVLCNEAKGNPLYNQREVEKRKILSLGLEPEFADAVLLPNNDPTEQAEQLRLQQLEMVLLQTGAPVPVSTRDNHAIHIDACRNAVNSMLQTAISDENQWPIMGAIGDHVASHIQSAETAGLNEQVADAKQWLNALKSTLQKLIAQEQQAIADGTHPDLNPQAPQEPGQAAPAAATARNEQEPPDPNPFQIRYADSPPSIRRQMELLTGFKPASEKEESPLAPEPPPPKPAAPNANN